MLKLTKTGIGLLARQYRSVLKKCWAINVGIWRTAEDIISKTRKMMAYMLGLLDSLLNIKSNAFDEQSAKATATELPFGAPTVAGTLTAFGANVMDGFSVMQAFKRGVINSVLNGFGMGKSAPTVAGTLSAFGVNVIDGILLNLQGKKFVTLKALPAAVVAATVVATTILPSDAYAGDTGGTGNNASGAYSVAFGIFNAASGDASSAFGDSNSASGQWASAFGAQNTASGYYSSAFGAVNKAYGYGSSAFGYNAQAGNSSDDTVSNNVTTNSKERYATAVGSYVQATGLYALALGNQKSGMTQTTASGTSAIAIGTGAQATENNSVAIGTNSVSAGANTVSVGSSTTQRQIKYVAAGTSDTDAVNLKQLNDAIAGVSGGGSSVTLDTTFDAESTNGATSQAIANYLDNNYYRKNKKSGILGGFEEGKIGNENDDNFSKFRADNDNFVTVENKAA